MSKPGRTRKGGGASAAPTLDHRATLRAWLEARGQRWTEQREVVLATFLASTEHLTSEDLHRLVAKKDASVGLSTVYRTLRLFVDGGIASERHFQDGLARYEPVRPHHDHLICLGCGEIVEFEDDEVEALQEGIARDKGYRLVSHRHELYGTCPSCTG